MSVSWELADQARLRAISEADLFPGVPEPTFDPYARIVARLLDVPVALVSIVDDEQQFFPAQVGLGEPWASRGGTPLSMSFCQHVVRGDAPLVVVDSTGDDRVSGNLAIQELDVIAYLGVPVRAPGGEPLGSLCAIANHPRHWTDDELAVLEEVADAVAQLVAVRTSAHRWARFAAEASHRLRTPVATARLELDDLVLWPELGDEVRDRVRAAAHRTGELAAIVDDLARLAATQERLSQHSVVVADVLRSALSAVGPDASIEGDLDVAVRTSPAVLRAVVGELLVALQSAGAAAVRVVVEATEGQVRIVVIGDGLAEVVPVPSDVHDRVTVHLRGRITPAPSPTVGFHLALPI